MNKTAIFLLGLGLGVVVGGGFGVFIGAAATEEGMRILSGAMESSAPADVDQPLTLAGKHFTVDYPGNWKVDTEDPDYDVDSFFDLNAPAQGAVIVHLVPPGLSVEELLEEWATNLGVSLMPEHERTTFSTWGGFEGQGVQLEGRMLVADGRIRMFGFQGEPMGFAIMEMRYDEDEPNNAAGYDLIERSFARVE